MVTSTGFASAHDIDGMVRFGYVRPGPYDTHLSIVILYEDTPEGRLYYVIEYDSGEGTQIKFAAGTNSDHVEEDPFDTARRECTEETDLVLPDRIECIWVGPRIQNRGGPGFHQKTAFLVNIAECSGTMRRMPRTDDDGDKQSPPFARTAEELLIDVKDGGLFWTHRPSLHEACKRAS